MPDQPHPIDVHVGQRVRDRRKALGITQDRLAQSLDLTFQQVQKYERGVNRISASKLYEASQVLQVPVNWFFEGEDDACARVAGRIEPAIESGLSGKETRDLIAAYCRLATPKLRRQVLDLIKGMAPQLRSAA